MNDQLAINAHANNPAKGENRIEMSHRDNPVSLPNNVFPGVHQPLQTNIQAPLLTNTEKKYTYLGCLCKSEYPHRYVIDTVVYDIVIHIPFAALFLAFLCIGLIYILLWSMVYASKLRFIRAFHNPNKLYDLKISLDSIHSLRRCIWLSTSLISGILIVVTIIGEVFPMDRDDKDSKEKMGEEKSIIGFFSVLLFFIFYTIIGLFLSFDCEFMRAYKKLIQLTQSGQRQISMPTSFPGLVPYAQMAPPQSNPYQPSPEIVNINPRNEIEFR